MSNVILFSNGCKGKRKLFPANWANSEKPPRGLRCLWKPRGPCWAESRRTWSHLNNCNKNAGELRPAQPRSPLSSSVLDSSLIFTGHTVTRAPPQNALGFDLSQEWKKSPFCLFHLTISTQFSMLLQASRIFKLTFIATQMSKKHT